MAYTLLVIVQNKKSKEWIAGFNPDGSPEMSPRIQDSYLFLDGFGASAYDSRNWHKEHIKIRKFTPPRPKVSKPKKTKSTKATRKKVSTVIEPPKTEIGVAT